MVEVGKGVKFGSKKIKNIEGKIKLFISAKEVFQQIGDD
jgi:hypothetical protein